MPGDSTQIHPSGEISITFFDSGHKYLDSRDREYVSGTSFLSNFFPKFNSDLVSKKVAEKQGKTQAQVLQEWSQASSSGVKLHENCENQFIGRRERFHQPTSQDEYTSFVCAYNTVEMLQNRYELIGCELIVFSPRYYLAGCIDLLVYCPNLNKYLILDWKRCKAIRSTGFDNETAYYPIGHLQNCNLVKYGLQIFLYQYIAQKEGYLPINADIERWLIHIGPGATEPIFIPLPDYKTEILEMMLHFNSDLTKKIPGIPF